MPQLQQPVLTLPDLQRPVVSPCAGAFTLMCDENWQVIWASPELPVLTGYATDDVLGKNPGDFLHGPDTDTGTLDQLRECVAHKKHFSGEMLNYKKDGTSFWVHLSFNPIFNDHNEFQHFVAIQTVNTYTAFIEEQTRAYVTRMERQRNVLIREVHHRIKNSLQGVAGMLRQHAQSEPQAAHVLEKAIAQVRTIAVVHGLEGKALYNEVVLCEMAPSIARMVQELVLPDGPHFTVTVNVPERIRVCEQERVPIALILNELILNAAKHLSATERYSTLSVGVAWQAQLECARITITNPGRLPDDFDFAAEQGIGTGLELVRSMLPANGATLTFANRAGFVETQLTLSPPVIYSVNPSRLPHPT
ncbi:PAS domain-containing protein [Pusillimonas sp. NJUB218]|uniref:PAS domain-containing sensor histidine kinase n=1 Tax=Pusillimonas sp. NJUB218 TaxID=2023230 RepID=UPI000F4CE8EA|nr:PAS domain-containing protein [Pusillimonas sp. NJUB218]